MSIFEKMKNSAPPYNPEVRNILEELITNFPKSSMNQPPFHIDNTIYL